MNRRLSRRLFLGGSAVALSLPFLPSLMTRTARAQNCTPPKRFMAWFVPNGMHMPDWTPRTTGTDWEMTPILAPLAPVRDKILVIGGLDHHATARGGTPGVGGHGCGTGCFLNMIPVGGNENNPNRYSVDQLLLPVLNPPGCEPRLPSLQLGVQGPNGLCDRGPCNFSRAISWDGGTPLQYIADPQQAFDRMFMGFNPTESDADVERRRFERKTVVDRVLAQANSLRVKLSPADQQKLDQYLDSVQQLQRRIDATNGTLSCTIPERPDRSPPLNFDRGITPSSIIENHFPIFLDLMALAFECDITRSLTFMVGNGTSNNNYEFVTGTSTPHHGTSHHQNRDNNIRRLRQINIWEIEQASALLQRLDSVTESDGSTLLDNTTFYLGSDVSDGDRHNTWDMPTVVAGRGALRVDGRHISYVNHTFPRPLVGPRSDVHTGRLLISIMQGHGLMTNRLGEATGILEEVMV